MLTRGGACCDSHIGGLLPGTHSNGYPLARCCDTNDCGPCCPACPTCPTERARRSKR